jgi:hypothetical protein
MYAATTFGGRDALEPMAAGLVIQLIRASAFDGDGEGLVSSAPVW